MAAHLQYQQIQLPQVSAPAQAHYRDGHRAPFANAANHQYVKPTTPKKSPAKTDAAQKKPPTSPPLPRQNTKTQPPSPPQIIIDNSHSVKYRRVGFLGEGGFARVYEVQDHRGQTSAIKVVTKDSLKTKKAKTKLYAEIKIHRSLQHPNIVRFGDCFEDLDNVYMTLELCEAGSLMDMLRRRKRFTEPESRYFMVQLIGACHYMHTHQVIHRDLKLGNLFLDADMNVKVGDFGLAALIENPGERKKTICGTPNYIAPEVLFDTANGHSFEVDTWSIGVILYTLVVGRPPFQTKDVKTIYKRIRDNEYEFPADREVSLDARELVQEILTPNPQERPTLHDIVSHTFFTAGTVPAYIPRTAHDRAPTFDHINRQMSRINLARLRKNALLDEEEPSSIAVNVMHPGISAASGRVKTGSASNASMLNSSVALAQQEREFHRAVQPSSPISALLGAARQPLVMAPGGSGGREREQPLIRKLQAAQKEAKSPGRALGSLSTNANAVSNQAHGYGLTREQNQRLGNLQDIEEEDIIPETKEHERVRRKELEAQKARIVAQMVPGEMDRKSPSPVDDDAENQPPQAPPKSREKEKAKASVNELGPRSSSSSLKLHGFDSAAHNLTLALKARQKGKVFRDPISDAELPDAKVFIVSWVDYCNKYGMGYALTDGSVGVYFNDSTSILLSPDRYHFDYIASRHGGAAYSRKNYNVNEYAEELKSKVYLLKHFEKYIMERLYGDYSYTFEDIQRTKGMDFVQKYLRMKHVIVFKLSHDVLQFNFYDHTKVILSSQALVVTHIGKDNDLTRMSLSELMEQSLNPPEDPVKAKFITRLVDKVKYTREILLSINSKTAGGDVESKGEGEGQE